MTNSNRPLQPNRISTGQFVIAAFSALILAGPALAQFPPQTVYTESVTIEQVQETQRFTGELRAKARAAVATQEDGRVMELLVREGAHVTKGDVLVRLDDRRLDALIAETQAALDAAKAVLEQRETELIQTQRDFDRSRNLVDRGVVTPQDHEHSDLAQTVASARRDAAARDVSRTASTLELLQVRLDDLTVNAPFDGRVVMKHTELGEWIHQGDPVVTLVSANAVEAWIEVPERFLAAAETADSRLQLDILPTSDRIETAEFRVIPDVHPQTRTFHIVADLENPEGKLIAGMSAAGWLPTSKLAAHLTVPRDAVVRDTQTAFAYRAVPGASGENVAERVAVQVLFESGDRLAIAPGGLAEGDTVVVEGNERLFPGTQLVLAPRIGGGLARTEVRPVLKGVDK